MNYAYIRSGIDPITEDRFAFQLLFSYLPILIATAIGPYLVSVARYVAILAPLNFMLFKSQLSARTVSSKITSLPPELSLPKSIMSRHWRLATLCSAIVLSNILAIMASAMFREVYTSMSENVDFIPVPMTTYPNQSIGDGYGPFYTVYSQLSLKARPTNWTTDRYFFRPFQLSQSNSAVNASDRYKVTTTGIGADLECHYIPSYPDKDNIRTSAGLDDSELPSLEPNITVVNTPNGTIPRGNTSQQPGGVCLSAFGAINGLSYANSTHSSGQINGVYVWPDWTPMAYYNIWGDAENTCSDSFPFMAFSIPLAPRPSNTTSTSMIAQLCTPVIKSGHFEVTVDLNGGVQSAVPKSAFIPLPNEPEKITWRKKINAAIQTGNSFFPLPGDNGQRYLQRRMANTYAATNWALILGNLASNSSLNTNNWVSGELPDPSVMASELAGIYRRLFTQYMALDPLATLPIMDSLPPFSASPDSAPLSGTVSTTQRRVIVSRTSYIVSAIILIFLLLTVVAVYTRPMDRGLPFVPTSLGVTLAFVAGSEALDDVKGTSSMSTRERERHLRQLDRRYFIGWGNSAAGVDGRGRKRVGYRRRYGLHREE